ncbi:hypothetical protein AYK61_01380 [Rhodococcus sp. SBT000017]|nr:hypothetical protein AYK61_01380 [Rhodococcus sp. SBT000017]
MGTQWSERDRPVLVEAVAYCDEHQVVRWHDLTDVTGLDYKEMRHAFDALAGATPPFFGHSDDDEFGVVLFSRPTERARREVGQWPSAESVLEALIQQLVETERDDSQTEDTRSRARKIRDAPTEGGGQVVGGVITAVIAGQFGA